MLLKSISLGLSAAQILGIAIRLLVGVTAEAEMGSLQPSEAHTWKLCTEKSSAATELGWHARPMRCHALH